MSAGVDTRPDGVVRAPATAIAAALLDAAPDAIVGVRADGTVVLANAQTERLFGYERGDLLGQPVELLVPERFRDVHPEHRRRYA